MVNFPYYLFSFDFLVADIYLGLQTVIHLLHLPIFAPILIIMLNQCMLLPQYKNSPPKAQTTAFKNSLLKIGGVDARSLVEIKRRRIGYTLSIYFGVATTQIPAYFQKVVDTHSFVGIITQQLSNSATQQLSNSATQQLSNSATRLCPDKWAAFTFRQQHHYIFSSTFADGKRAVSVFPIKPQRVPHMRIQIEENIPFKTLACSASLRLIKIKPLSIQRSQRITGKYQTISQPP